MSEENKIGYYAVIPSTILFNNDLKPNEKLLYAVITVLSNKEGYMDLSEEEKEFQKSLDGTNVSREEYNEVLNKVQKINERF